MIHIDSFRNRARKLVQAPSNLITGRPKAALLFWFFGGFSCAVPLFIVIFVTY